MTEDSKFELLKNLYEDAFAREESRKDTFDQKSSNLVGFLGATVGIFIGLLVPDLLSEEFFKRATESCPSCVLWIFSMMFFAVGLSAFLALVCIWRKMLSPHNYMWPDAKSYKMHPDLDSIKVEYLDDLEKSLRHNQETVNNLGTQFIRMVDIIMFIVVSLSLAVVFFVACKLSV